MSMEWILVGGIVALPFVLFAVLQMTFFGRSRYHRSAAHRRKDRRHG
jgi:hypothetical protein